MLTSDTSVRKTHSRPVTVKIAMWSARHRWSVFGLWFGLVIGLMMASSIIPASKTVKQDTAGSDLESMKAFAAFKAAGGQNNVGEDFFLLVNHSTLKVSDPIFKSTVDKLIAGLKELTYTENDQANPLFTELVNPYQAPPQLGFVSADQSTVRIYGRIAGEPGTLAMYERLKPYNEKIKQIKAPFADYKLLVSNSTLNNLAAQEDSLESLNHSMLITLIPTFLILLSVFGALVASVIPLILAITAVIGAVGIISIYGRLSGETDLTSAGILIVLMGMAVAIDYSLFVISRYRHERFKGRPKMQAIEIASGTAGRAVFFSGMLVAISIFGLFFLGGSLTSMALGVIAVVLLAVLGSFTFLPAVLAILGNGVNWGRIPYFGREREEGHGIWSVIVQAVMRRPVLTTVISVALLLGLASPLLHIKLGFVLPNAETLEGVQASKLLTEKWPQGAELKLQVAITGADRPETQAAISRFETTVLAIPGLSGPVQKIPSVDGKVVLVSFYQAGSYNDQASQDIVKKLRQEVVPAYFKDLSGTKAYVTGLTAQTIDWVIYFMNPIVWVFVLSLSFLVLLLVFRSLVIALKAIVLNLLSTGAAYGVVILVFQDGWLGVKTTGVMQFYLPVFIFTIVFGLSMDYHMFILTRIKELRDKGQPTKSAVADAISATSGTITGAAAIMVVVFGDFFVGLEDPSIRQLGLGLAAAVLLDATLVRCILLPAAMELLGELNWWLPKALRWLPTITVESEPEEEVETRAEPVSREVELVA